MSEAKRDRKYICSELVYDCFDQIGVPFSLRDEYVSPHGTSLDHRVQLRYRIMRCGCRQSATKRLLPCP